MHTFTISFLISSHCRLVKTSHRIAVWDSDQKVKHGWGGLNHEAFGERLFFSHLFIIALLGIPKVRSPTLGEYVGFLSRSSTCKFKGRRHQS